MQEVKWSPSVCVVDDESRAGVQVRTGASAGTSSGEVHGHSVSRTPRQKVYVLGKSFKSSQLLDCILVPSRGVGVTQKWTDEGPAAGGEGSHTSCPVPHPYPCRTLEALPWKHFSWIQSFLCSCGLSTHSSCPLLFRCYSRSGEGEVDEDRAVLSESHWRQPGGGCWEAPEGVSEEVTGALHPSEHQQARDLCAGDRA